MLTDGRIHSLQQKTNFIQNWKPESLVNIGYDLTSDHFITGEGKKQERVQLEPGESAFMGSEETIQLPNNMAAKAYLKNSRIRMGLTMDAPVFQPGHKTRIYARLTNVSSDVITLQKGEKYVMLTFEDMGEDAQRPYEGAFTDELDYKGMGDYQNLYNKQKLEIKQKKDDLRNVEKSIYANVLVILTVFVALFSFLTANLSMVANGISQPKSFFMLNFMLMGGISFLMALLTNAMDMPGKKLSAWMAGGAIVLSAAAFFIL